MGNYCVSHRQKKEKVDEPEYGRCAECNIELTEEQICDRCLAEEIKHLDNLHYIRRYISR